MRGLARLTPLGLALGVAVSPLPPQQPPPPTWKGAWEPVSFPEDTSLLAVVFVTAAVGWAAGEKGTLIHTKDGGRTWEAHLGGDPP